MRLSEIIKKKNNMEAKNYPTLPNAFLGNTIKEVAIGLVQAGYDVYSVVVEGKKVNMARKNEVEIYFDNSEAIYTYSDYGNVEGKVFPLSLDGTCYQCSAPRRLWCRI